MKWDEEMCDWLQGCLDRAPLDATEYSMGRAQFETLLKEHRGLLAELKAARAYWDAGEAYWAEVRAIDPHLPQVAMHPGRAKAIGALNKRDAAMTAYLQARKANDGPADPA